MNLYNVKTALGVYPCCSYNTAMYVCTSAITSGTSPFAIMYDSTTQETVNEFYDSEILQLPAANS